MVAHHSLLGLFRYFGMLLPALPPKSVVKTTGFIKSRMRGLSLFMDHLRMQPFLRSDASVLAFISVQDPNGAHVP